MEIGEWARLQWVSFGDLSAVGLYELLRFRQAIFVVEQSCAYPDLDGRDECAQHLMLRVEEALSGYLRLIPDPADKRIAIGRVTVTAALRGRGLGRMLMAEALARCRRDFADYAITLSAQTYLTGFYESFGFRAISAPYDDYGVPHVDMVSNNRAVGGLL